MKALISPNEPSENGYRVAEIHPTGFDVAEPLFWVDIEEILLNPSMYWYDPADQTIKPIPQPEPGQTEEQP